jgi:hypothetical protein
MSKKATTIGATGLIWSFCQPTSNIGRVGCWPRSPTGIPVIATPNCGVSGLDGIQIVDAGDPESLKAAYNLVRLTYSVHFFGLSMQLIPRFPVQTSSLVVEILNEVVVVRFFAIVTVFLCMIGSGISQGIRYSAGIRNGRSLSC